MSAVVMVLMIFFDEIPKEDKIKSLVGYQVGAICNFVLQEGVRIRNIYGFQRMVRFGEWCKFVRV